MKPVNLFLLGAAKCGTTTLADRLERHSEIELCAGKEAHFFDSDVIFEKGIDFYHDMFQPSVGATYRCDATPAYLACYAKVIPRLIDYLPSGTDSKFIVILRNPADRAWSHYQHLRSEGVEERGFREAIDAELVAGKSTPERWRNLYHDGLYSEQVYAWLRSFDRDRFLFLLYEELFDPAASQMSQVWDFLRLPPIDTEMESRRNVMSEVRFRSLIVLLRQTWIRRMFHRIDSVKRRRFVKLLRRLNRRQIDPDRRPTLDPGDRDFLLDRYTDDIAMLEKAIDLNVSRWLR